MAMYNFNEGTGTTTHDDSGRNKTGTLYGNTYWTQEKDLNLTQNAALYFDGSGDYVKVAHNNDFNISSADVNGFVISAMIKVPSSCTKTYLSICSKILRYTHPDHPYDHFYDYSYGFYFYLTNGNLRFSAYNGQCDVDPTNCYVNIQDVGGQDLRDGQWHFVAVEFLNGTYKLFIDPTETFNGEVQSLTKNIQPGNKDTYFFIGRRDISWDYDKDFQGTIDCVYFYEIEPASVQNPSHRMWGFNNEGYWSFDEGNGTPNGIVNDLVRWTSKTAGYHNYGKIYGTGFYFLDRSIAWKGEHAAEFNNTSTPNTYIQVNDSTNRLDFAAVPGTEDLYIEFLFMPNNVVPTQYTPLIEKYDYSQANGYRIFLTGASYSTGYLNFEVARNGSTGLLSTYPNTFGNGWIHVWAWAQNGILHLKIKDETHGIYYSEYTQAITCGIGATSSPLYFGSSYSYSNRRYFDGWMDEVVIGRCFPGLEY
jgi:hypothetical protein